MIMYLQARASENLETVVRVLDIMIAIGRYMLPFTAAFALLSLAATVNSIATVNIAGTILWLFLASAATIFAFQLMQTRMRRKVRRKLQDRMEFPRAAQA